MYTFISEYAVSLVVSFLASFVIFATKSLHISYTAKGHTSRAPQSAHRNPTPRIGGVAILLGVFSGIAVSFFDDFQNNNMLFLASALPVLIGGLGEDIGRDVSPRNRLILAFVSAGLAVALLDIWIVETKIDFLDILFVNGAMQIAITIAFSAGFCHAFNLIDGLNGLAIGQAMTIAAGLMYLSFSYNQPEITLLTGVLFFGALGLFVFNFPAGRLFLGDAGAYSIGHILIWSGIAILWSAESLAPFSMLLLFFWPIMETAFSIFRRLFRGQKIDHADRLHFHQVVMRMLQLKWFGLNSRHKSNPIASGITLVIAAIPTIAGLNLRNNNMIAFSVFVLLILAYVFSYVAIKNFARASKRTTL